MYAVLAHIGFPQALKLIPGPQFEMQQELPSGLKAKEAGGSQTQRPVTLVFFIGGCTYAEISGIRFLSRHEGNITQLRS